MIYLIVFILLLYFAIKFDDKKLQKRKVYNVTVISCIILVLMAGLRYRVGTDTLIYTDEYLTFKPLNLLSYNDVFNDLKYRPGWILFTSFFKTIGANLYVYQLAIAAIINVGVFYFLGKKVDNFFSSILIYYVICFIFFNTEVVRQGISISIFLYAYLLLEKGKVFKYILLGFLAFSFHESAIVMLLVPFVMRVKVSKIIIPLAVAIVILFVFAPYIRQLSYGYFSSFDLVANKADAYFSRMESSNYSFNVSFILNMILNVLFPLYVIYLNRFNAKMNSFYMLAIFSVFFYTISSFLPMMYRIRFYFLLFDSVLFIDFFKHIVKNNKILYILCIVGFLLIKSRVFFTLADDQTPVYVKYYPYTSVFNEDIVTEREMLRWY